jgi:hypothetical protein
LLHPQSQQQQHFCWPLKQAAVATHQLRVAASANKIINAAELYFCTTSLLHVSIILRETMCWWLALQGKLCRGRLPLLAIPNMVTCYILQNNYFLPGFHK